MSNQIKMFNKLSFIIVDLQKRFKYKEWKNSVNI